MKAGDAGRNKKTMSMVNMLGKYKVKWTVQNNAVNVRYSLKYT